MKKINTLFVKYKIMGSISLMVLFFTQIYMTYHTYAWKDHDYFALIKPLVGNQYLYGLEGDLLYPGGQKIVERYVAKNYTTLESLYQKDSVGFNANVVKSLEELFTELRQDSNLDSFLDTIFKEQSLASSVQYRVAVHDFGLRFGNTDVDLLNKNILDRLKVKDSLFFSYGGVIDGNLTKCTESNRFTTISVDNKDSHKYYIRFSLWVDSPSKTRDILVVLIPVLLLSLASIALMGLLFFSTFKNWAKQKKLADLKQDFVNNITHELNTPLTTIIVANRNIQDEYVLKNKDLVLNLTHIIERNSQRLTSLFSRVLRSEDLTKNTLNKREYNLYSLCIELVEDYKLSLESSEKVEITLYKTGSERNVFLDKFWFTSMIYNLFDNGIKYNTNENICLTVGLVFLEDKILLKVVDNGIGIDTDIQSYVFDKFYRKEGNSMKGKEGLGLGLYYVNQCVRAHDWQISIDSVLSEGTSFIIEIK